jgi:hypothetical protein
MQHWYLSLCMGGNWSDQSPHIQSDKYQCRIDTAILSWWWARGCPKHVEKRNKYILNRNVYLVGLIYEIVQGLHGQQNIKFRKTVFLKRFLCFVCVDHWTVVWDGQTYQIKIIKFISLRSIIIRHVPCTHWFRKWVSYLEGYRLNF